MAHDIIASRQFGVADQNTFAALSGDCNPMHMDPVAARRTQAGAPVVHGIHTLLWALDSLARCNPDLPAIATLRVRFDKLVYVGDSVDAVLTHRDETGLRLEVKVGGAIGLRLQVGFGPSRPQPAALTAGLLLYQPDTGVLPLDLTLDEMANRAGRIGFAVPPAEIASVFPNAVRAWNANRIAALICSTYLVGMICPGLHSIFGGLSVVVCDDNTMTDGIAFEVTRTDSRFRMVRMEIVGSGLSGTIESFMRRPPAAQQALSALTSRVAPYEFAGSTALVVGGSRGVGELTAKLLAAGGARVIITYVAGQADAERLQDEIMTGGGRCDILRYDVRAPTEPQLQSLSVVADTLYYCATPFIFRRKAGLFVVERFAEFLDFYVTGFYNLYQGLRMRHPSGISIFYPSSIAVEARPADMAEYAMSKMAGEVLCADMVAHQQPIAITINRLPRLPTDQTATLTEFETADPVAVMLPIIRAVQTNRFA